MRARLLTPLCNLYLRVGSCKCLGGRRESLRWRHATLPQLWPPLTGESWGAGEVWSYLVVAGLLSQITNFPGPGRGGASTGGAPVFPSLPRHSTAQHSTAQAQLNLQAVSTGGWLDSATVFTFSTRARPGVCQIWRHFRVFPGSFCHSNWSENRLWEPLQRTALIFMAGCHRVVSQCL